MVHKQGDGTATELDPTYFLEAKNRRSVEKRYAALIIINCPISDYEHLECLLDHASYILCADGGANRLHDLMVEKFPDRDPLDAISLAKPNAIHGDLDSLKDEVRQRYERIGVEVSQDPDQYSTDFGKAVKKLVQVAPNVQDVLVLGSIGGRVDQGIGLLHEVYREQKFLHPELRFWLFSEASVSVLLQPGTSIIRTPLKTTRITQNVGILPLYGKAVLTLKGFEWDVVDWPSEMGAQVSTSNHIVADEVYVTTDKTVLFTVERMIGRTVV